MLSDCKVALRLVLLSLAAVYMHLEYRLVTIIMYKLTCPHNNYVFCFLHQIDRSSQADDAQITDPTETPVSQQPQPDVSSDGSSTASPASEAGASQNLIDTHLPETDVDVTVRAPILLGFIVGKARSAASWYRASKC